MVLFPNTDITIYNRYYDNNLGYDRYQRTVIKDVDWQGKRNSTINNNGLLLADSTKIFIDKLENYVNPKRFKKLSDAERPNYFTFASGDKIVKGDVSFEVTGISPYRLSDLEDTFDNVIDIKSVNDTLPNHIEVEGV
ncbi:hypothetical protein GCM10008908_24670 [Clostridium subterminale]|uniref:Uncharacterized protein n=1 Tax=Clostridium subterminale TaxID=1550 RepID=A0ABP3W2D2_CLOSU